MGSSAQSASPVTDHDPVSPRYGRIALFSVSVVVTVTTVLGGVGVLSSGGTPSYAADQNRSGARTDSSAAASLTAAEQRGEATNDAAGSDSESSVDNAPIEDSTEEPAPVEEVDPEDLLLPADSGEGRRVVFDEGAQRVWLVRSDGSVKRTYLVSGSVYDNLDPGTYSVFSKDKEAWGIDGSELRYMVRFTTGAEAAIGFHNIPVLEGKKVQTRDELGTALSHGCIRQWGQDAKALWDFAPLGTAVVVVDTTAVATEVSEDQSEED